MCLLKWIEIYVEKHDKDLWKTIYHFFFYFFIRENFFIQTVNMWPAIDLNIDHYWPNTQGQLKSRVGWGAVIPRSIFSKFLTKDTP